MRRTSKVHAKIVYCSAYLFFVTMFIFDHASFSIVMVLEYIDQFFLITAALQFSVYASLISAILCDLSFELLAVFESREMMIAHDSLIYDSEEVT